MGDVRGVDGLWRLVRVLVGGGRGFIIIGKEGWSMGLIGSYRDSVLELVQLNGSMILRIVS